MGQKAVRSRFTSLFIGPRVRSNAFVQAIVHPESEKTRITTLKIRNTHQKTQHSITLSQNHSITQSSQSHDTLIVAWSFTQGDNFILQISVQWFERATTLQLGSSDLLQGRSWPSICTFSYMERLAPINERCQISCNGIQTSSLSSSQSSELCWNMCWICKASLLQCDKQNAS